MICELYNRIGKYNENIIGISADKETEISLLLFVCMIFFTVFFTVMFAWWVIPLKTIRFKCNRKQ